MVDLKDRSYNPTLEEISKVVKNAAFDAFCAELKDKYDICEQIDYSSCSMEPGWNLKFKKSGKSLCTIYLREGYFTVMVVVGRKEKERVEKMLPDCSIYVREVYERTGEGNGQRWLMIDLEDVNASYNDVLKFIEIRCKEDEKKIKHL